MDISKLIGKSFKTVSLKINEEDDISCGRNPDDSQIWEYFLNPFGHAKIFLAIYNNVAVGMLAAIPLK